MQYWRCGDLWKNSSELPHGNHVNAPCSSYEAPVFMINCEIRYKGFDQMFVKMLVAWAAIVICLSVQGQSQYDPLGSNIFILPDDMRRTSSLDPQKIYIDPNADPLGIDPLMRPLDPEHTAEYLDKISGRTYLGPFVPVAEDLAGNWKLNLLGGMPGEVYLQLVQNRDAVFGRGTLSLAGSTNAVTASG